MPSASSRCWFPSLDCIQNKKKKKLREKNPNPSPKSHRQIDLSIAETASLRTFRWHLKAIWITFHPGRQLKLAFDIFVSFLFLLVFGKVSHLSRCKNCWLHWPTCHSHRNNYSRVFTLIALPLFVWPKLLGIHNPIKWSSMRCWLSTQKLRVKWIDNIQSIG